MTDLDTAVALIPDHVQDQIHELIEATLAITDDMWAICREYKALVTAVDVVADDRSGWFEDHGLEVHRAVYLEDVFDALHQVAGWISADVTESAPPDRSELKLAMYVRSSLEEAASATEPCVAPAVENIELQLPRPVAEELVEFLERVAGPPTAFAVVIERLQAWLGGAS